MTAKKNNTLRFLRLLAGSAVTLGAARTTLKAVVESDVVETVDGLSEQPPNGGEWPRVSVIVPARNEAHNLPDLLESLLDQRYPDYEVIVIDDQSTDATPRILEEWIARSDKLRVISGTDLPRSEGWLGKPHAMSQGAAVATGDWLLFTDADTRHHPLSLSSSVAYAIRRGADLFSIFPHYELVSPSERLIMPLSFLGIMWLYPADKVNDPNSDVAISNGQYSLVRRSVYDAVGGIERVKGQIVEDLEFAKVIKGEGHRLLIADGRHLMDVRMYTNFAEIWQGWSKNIVIATRENPRTIPMSVAAIIAGTGTPFLLTGWTIRKIRAARKSGRRDDALFAAWSGAITLANLGVYGLTRRRIDRVLGLPPGWVLTQPLGSAIIGLIMLYSMARLLTGRGLVWKDRTYFTNESGQRG